jgi:hypothetical protein
MKFKEASYFLMLVVLSASCGNNPGEDNSVSDKSEKSSPINCYQYANSGDTIILKLIRVGESITGTLVYKMPQKNTSKGTIQGRMTEDLLIVRYTPLVDSSVIQQKVFRLKEKYFVEGHGATNNENGQVRFKNIDDLKFVDTVRLEEITCE